MSRAEAACVLAALRSYATYNPETGQFHRNGTTAANAKAGELAGSVGGKGYRYLQVSGRAYRANRLAWLWMTGEWPAGQVDHADGDVSNDRWANLREATNAQNCANARMRTDNTTGFKGIKPLRGRWQARIGANGSQHIGTFDTAEEAHAAYLDAARIRYGQFARAK